MLLTVILLAVLVPNITFADEELRKDLKTFGIENIFLEIIKILGTIFRKILCWLTGSIIDALLGIRKLLQISSESFKQLSNICFIFDFEPIKYFIDRDVCEGMIDSHIAIIMYIVDNTPNLSGHVITAILFQCFGCESDDLNWQIPLPPYINNTSKPSVSNISDTFKVVQITDIHFDPTYVTGSSVICNKPICCQSETKAYEAIYAAGRWGAYKTCDISLDVVQNAFQQINKQHTKFEYVYFTGDIISHKVWATSVESNTKSIRTIMSEFATKFNVTVFPILGNHESHPFNTFIPKNVSSEFVSAEWLMKLVAEEWGHWLPKETQSTILKGGYYTVSPKKGFRIIALNSNVCLTYNLWLLHENNDPYDQLKWLVTILKEAERNGEAVHLLSHVPTGETFCLKTWSENFRNIIRRFSSTIKAVFNGHTHNDELIVYFDENNEKSIGVAYNGGSLTTYENNNPNYRIYDMDSNNYEVIDYEEWTYNITEANLHPNHDPVWYKLYSFKKAYEMDSLSPSNFDGLLRKMAKNPKLMEKYFRYKSREGNLSECDEECHKENLCLMATSTYGDNSKCNELMNIWEKPL